MFDGGHTTFACLRRHWRGVGQRRHQRNMKAYMLPRLGSQLSGARWRGENNICLPTLSDRHSTEKELRQDFSVQSKYDTMHLHLHVHTFILSCFQLSSKSRPSTSKYGMLFEATSLQSRERVHQEGTDCEDLHKCLLSLQDIKHQQGTGTSVNACCCRHPDQPQLGESLALRGSESSSWWP